MPASSRKRNKGRDRKAKQLAKKEEKVENERLKMHELWLSDLVVISCGHELVPVNITSLDLNHPVAKFMITFYTYWMEGLVTPCGILRQAMQTHPQVFKDESHREMIMNIMIRIGTNMVMLDKSGSLCLAQTIMVLEHYDGEGSSRSINAALYNRDTAIKRTHLQPGDEYKGRRRDCLKFFRKRITCKCLKRLHLDARKELPKVGKCMNCKDIRERTLLDVCSRCMVTQYCSRECQVADRLGHRNECDNFVIANRDMHK